MIKWLPWYISVFYNVVNATSVPFIMVIYLFLQIIEYLQQMTGLQTSSLILDDFNVQVENLQGTLPCNLYTAYLAPFKLPSNDLSYEQQCSSGI